MTAQDLTCFGFEDHLIRVVMKDGEPWFVAKDVCRALGILQATRAVEPLDDDEKGVSSTHTLGGEQDVLIVSESGLYTIILRSRAATTPGSLAHRFRKWVTAEVLPQIRKTGHYRVMPEDVVREELAEIGTNQWLSEIAMVRECRRIHGVGAAKSLWRRLKLPDPLGQDGPSGCDISGFVADCLEVTRDPRDRLSAIAMHAAYEAWCRGRGVTPLPITVFARRLPEVAGQFGFVKSKASTSIYSGVTLRAAAAA